MDERECQLHHAFTRVRLWEPPYDGHCAGRLVAASDAPFGLHVWGLSEYTSVGYPAGMGQQILNDVSLPAVP